MNNTETIEIIKTFIKEKAKKEEYLTHSFFDKIKNEIVNLVRIFPGIAEKDDRTLDHLYQTSVKEFQSVNPIDIDPSNSLTKKGLPIWLTEERKKSIKDDYIKRYMTFLAKKGRSEKVLSEISTSSEKILSKLGDPKSEKSFYIKGLVVGSVQSGKTGNFNAVINRSIDAGYSLIIVLSGIMEDLRSQTQLRIEEEVIGEGTVDVTKDRTGFKGVGEIRRFGEMGDQNVSQVFSVTSYKSDFKKSVKDTVFSLNNKNILVCKKNTGVLKNLLIWLSDYLNENKEKHDIPFLIVDDEADNASLNNLGKKGVEYASAINGHIRALLDLFTKKSYLGYTATPFANVLQDRNQTIALKWPVTYKMNGEQVLKEFNQVGNIFPDDFIELLNTPSNYVGAKQIFETVFEDNIKLPLVELIHDTNIEFPSHVPKDEKSDRAVTKYDDFPVNLPRSLIEATQCFILTIALRFSRLANMTDSGFLNPHHTMLVHISRFITWQNKTKELLIEYLWKLESDINNDLPNNSKLIYGTLEKTWDKYYAAIVHNIRAYLPEGYQDEFLLPKTFNDIRPFLIDAVKGIEIKAVNSATGDKLHYEKDNNGNGKKIIAVGGNRLSRGFTLEGLTINYFIRNTNFSDTLLQMGRWFGYRPGYLDCCKIFTNTDAVNKFDATTRAIEELEIEFKKMSRLERTPADFVLRVRKHPGTLKVTRPSILKNTKLVNWSYQDQLVQTTKFIINDAVKLTTAWEAFKGFIKDQKNNIIKNKGQDFYLIKLDVQQLIDFLKLPNAFENIEIPQIIKFIEIAKEKNKLRNWTIAIKTSGKGKVLFSEKSGLDENITLSERSGPIQKNSHYRDIFFTKGVFGASGKSANIVGAGKDFSLLLSDEKQKEVEALFRNEILEDYKKKGILNPEQKSQKTTIPERVYREAMSDDEGLLVVYLMDLDTVFRKGENDLEMDEMVAKNRIDTDIPLIGYAIGFPPISPDPGGEYLHGDYDIEDEIDETEEWDESMEATDE
ncbi:Z1 domain-containing protein [Pedobacter alpinus]|uniref:Z1 domain-containing protein n=1 Tax=Pedobacter alpinus TaxID=1590643 RepID=A0ABW5TU48_9SPHI